MLKREGACQHGTLRDPVPKSAWATDLAVTGLED